MNNSYSGNKDSWNSSYSRSQNEYSGFASNKRGHTQKGRYGSQQQAYTGPRRNLATSSLTSDSNFQISDSLSQTSSINQPSQTSERFRKYGNKPEKDHSNQSAYSTSTFNMSDSVSDSYSRGESNSVSYRSGKPPRFFNRNLNNTNAEAEGRSVLSASILSESSTSLTARVLSFEQTKRQNRSNFSDGTQTCNTGKDLRRTQPFDLGIDRHQKNSFSIDENDSNDEGRSNKRREQLDR